VLIAPEAGQPHDIVNNLAKQLASPDSVLRKGKLTSKTRSLAPSVPAPAPAAIAAAPEQPLQVTLQVAVAGGGATPPASAPGDAAPARDAAGAGGGGDGEENTRLKARVAELEEEVDDLKDKLESAELDLETLRKASENMVENLQEEVAKAKAASTATASEAALETASAAAMEMPAQAAVVEGGPTPEEVAALKSEIEQLREHLQEQGRKLVLVGGEAGASQDSDELERLRGQVSSLTFQLQELQVAAADTPRVPELKLPSPPASSSNRKMTLEPPPDPDMEPRSLSRRPSSEAPKRNVLEPPPNTSEVFSGNEGPGRRPKARSRTASPERIGAVSPSSPALSQVMSAVEHLSEEQVKKLSQERDDARAALVKEQEQCAGLRAQIDNLRRNVEAARQEIVEASPAGARQEPESEVVASLNSQIAELQQMLVTAKAMVSGSSMPPSPAVSQHKDDGLAEEWMHALTAADGLAERNTSAEAELETLRKTVQKLQSSLELAKSSLEHEHDARAEAEAELETLRTQQAALAGPKEPSDSVSAGVSIMSTELERLRDEARGNEARIRELQEQLAGISKQEGAAASAPAEPAGTGTGTESEKLLMLERAKAAEKRTAELEGEVTELHAQLAAFAKVQSVQALASSHEDRAVADLNLRLAEALAAVNQEKSTVARLEQDKRALDAALGEAKTEVTELKKQKLALIDEVKAAGELQTAASAEKETWAQKLQQAEQDKEALKAQVHALEVQVGEMRGRESSLQDQLARSLEELQGAKNTFTTSRLEVQKMEQEVARLREAEEALKIKAADALRETKLKDIELERVRRELEEINGTRYGEMASLKAQLEIVTREKEVALLGKTLKEKAQQGERTAGGPTNELADSGEPCRVCGSPEVSPSRSSRGGGHHQHAGPRHLGDTEAASKRPETELPSMSILESELNRVRAEIANSPRHKMASSPPRYQSVSAQSPQRVAVDRSLQERLDLLAAALSYNGLTVASGFGAFDQDRDGRVSQTDLRKSLHELELDMPLADLQALFAHMDADADGFISDAEWGAALRDADPLSVLASQGVRMMGAQQQETAAAFSPRRSPPRAGGHAPVLQVPADASAADQARESFETIRNELAKARADAERLRADAEQTTRRNAELEDDLRRVRKTCEGLQRELADARHEVARLHLISPEL
jgi:DNA repair exonuclease SbcCD ATPase subunit